MRRPTPARVSVIIATKDRHALLRQALASVRALEGSDLELEVIVADNGSTDGAKAVAREFGARFVRALTPGPAAARNAGIRAATGDYLAFLDDDDIWLPGHLRPHLRLLDEHPECAAVVGQIINTDFSLALRWGPWPEHMPADGDCFAAFLGYCPQIGATVARTSVRDSTGLLDETLLSDEDWDWHLRLALRHGIGFVATPCVLFRQRPDGVRDELIWMRLAYSRKVFWKNIWRSGVRRPSPGVVARQCLRHNGAYAAGFLKSAAAYVAAGDSASARQAIVRAICASPVHTVWAFMRNAEMRRTLLGRRGALGAVAWR